MIIDIYIDGSSKGNPGPGGAGIVIKDASNQAELSTLGIPLGYVTNNQAEFLALKHALTELKTQGLSHNTINIHGLPASRRDLLPELEGQGESGIGDGDQEPTQRISQLTFSYVRGHNGNHGNEPADSLAQEAAGSQKGMKREYTRQD
jgi:ribonuclease HI